MEYYTRIGTTDFVTAFRSPPPRDLFWFQIQNLFKYKNGPCSTLCQTTAVVNTPWPSSHCRCCKLLIIQCDRRNLLLTTIVGCDNNTSDMKLKSNKRRANFLLQWWYSCLYTVAKITTPHDLKCFIRFIISPLYLS